jgi:Ser/Thr protein kinase RdoA (MazF antagonist)
VTVLATAGDPALAPDDAVPQRDRLLDTEAMARRFEALLGADGPIGVDRCAIELAHYRAGRRLSTLYRVHVGDEEHRVAARTYAPGAPEVLTAACDADTARRVGALRALAGDAELHAVYSTFPHDRKVDAAPIMRPPRSSGCVAAHLVRYVPERLAVARWDDADGRAVLYAKAYADPATAVARGHAALQRALGDRDPHLRLPRVHSALSGERLLVAEALPGRALSTLSGDALEAALYALGTALARLHQLPVPSGLDYGGRLPERLRRAAALIARMRPDARDAAADLHRALGATRPRRETGLVPVHRDATVRNALLADGRVGLVDLDDVAAGPPATDFARVLAWLLAQRTFGRITAAEHDRQRAALISGYARLRPPPAEPALRWETAAATLEGRGRKAVTRLDAVSARHLEPLLVDALELVS